MSSDANYIESCFSTYLYTGNGSTQTITNGIDLAGKGGLVWWKSRNNASEQDWVDTARGVNSVLRSDTTGAAQNNAVLSSFNSNGFTTGSYVAISGWENVTWTFRKQPKFFDVVTYTGNGSLATRYISHSLGSVPGTIIVKRTDTTSDWIVIHRGTTFPLILNSTAAASSTNRNNGYPDLTYTDATQFAVSDGASGVSAVNASGGTYVAYLFAHNAGGFGLTGTDNVISCGSTTGGVTSLGFEPQWVLVKNTTSTGYWRICDNMRGMPFANSTATNTIDGASLFPNVSDAEDNSTSALKISGNSFFLDTSALGTGTFIYIAIRRGPMKTPTSGTSVFKPTAYTGNGSTTTINAGFPIDLSMTRIRGVIGQTLVVDRLRGASQRLFTDVTTAESTSASAVTSLASNTSITFGVNGDTNSSGQTYVTWDFQRAPGFFDEVCYTGTGVAGTVTHNLGVAPELMIVKRRDTAANWSVYAASQGPTVVAFLNTINAFAASSVYWNNTNPTSSVFTLGTSTTINASGGTYVAYLFASCPGVSKCGSYTGTGATQTISCGFTGGARFVLIKRTNSTGNWGVLDTARGMVSGTDPYLNLNTTAAEVNANNVYTATGGFQLVSSDANFNASGGSYIFLAVA